MERLLKGDKAVGSRELIGLGRDGGSQSKEEVVLAHQQAPQLAAVLQLSRKLSSRLNFNQRLTDWTPASHVLKQVGREVLEPRSCEWTL